MATQTKGFKEVIMLVPDARKEIKTTNLESKKSHLTLALRLLPKWHPELLLLLRRRRSLLLRREKTSLIR